MQPQTGSKDKLAVGLWAMPLDGRAYVRTLGPCDKMSGKYLWYYDAERLKGSLDRMSPRHLANTEGTSG